MGKVQPLPAMKGASANGKPLPANLRHDLESNSGVDLSDVKYHVGHQATLLGASAFSHGSNIHLAPGKEHHLAHEASHVVQQRQGEVNNPAPPLAEGLVQVKEE